jgi:anti-sigma B factor antagonist
MIDADAMIDDETRTFPDPLVQRLQIGHREVEQRVCVVELEGEVDLASAASLKSTLTGLVGDGYSQFVLDFGQVGHMDSTGLGVLIGFRKRLGEDGALVIARVPQNVWAVFKVTGLDKTLDICATIDVAVARAQAGGVAGPPPPLSADSAMVIGLASTALLFADTVTEQVQRWLRVLRLHGEAGHILTSLGLGESPLVEIAEQPPGPKREVDATACVVEEATHYAIARGASTVATTDLLSGVMTFYGAAFDRVLAAHGSDRDELSERLEASHPS